VYLGTHCNLGPKKACCPITAYSACDTTVYLFTDATSHSVPRPHWFVYICVMTQQNVDGNNRSPNFGFCGLLAPKPYIPHWNSRKKGTSFGCRLVPEMIPTAQNCVFWAVPLSQTPPQKYQFSVVLGIFSTVYACAHRFTSFVAKMLKIGAG